MENIRGSKEFKQLERALVKRLKIKAKPDALVKDLVRRYMDAWVRGEKAKADMDVRGDQLIDSRDRWYNNPSMKTLSDAEGLMERLLRQMDVKIDDLAAAMEDEDDEL